MNKVSRLRILSVVIVSLVLLALLLVLFLPQNAAEVQSSLVALPPVTGDFERAEGPRTFEFPADHGPHEDFQTEWWYYTGNLTSDEGRRFGYQLTFFRRALLPENERADRSSDWAVEQVYLAHFTLTDVNDERFYFWERTARGEGGLAGSEVNPLFETWLYDWRVTQLSNDRYELNAAQDNVRIKLLLEDVKGPVLQHDSGLSPKGPQPGNASYYYSQTRLVTSGNISIGDETIRVNGTSWMDHEFSTSALSEGQIGWDWFSLQLDSGKEIMVYTIRREDGTIDPFSNGTIIEEDGSTRRLSKNDFEIEVTDTWQSQKTETEYPSAWVLHIPSEQIRLLIEPLVQDQELVVSYTYWEGAAEITGVWGQEEVSGRGYVELTGYAASMAGEF